MRRLPVIVCLCALACGALRADGGQRATGPGSGMPLPHIEFVGPRRVEG